MNEIPRRDATVEVRGDRLVDTETGHVAVVYSPGFGAGWTSWNNVDPFLPAVAQMVLESRRDEIDDEFMTKLGYPDAYTGGAKDLQLVWMEPGQAFLINEYDGSESIETQPSNIYRA